MASVDAPPSPSASKRDTSDASDLDPADFLKSIRELSAQREREDSERYRKLEEEVERSRAERKARRAERAYSISPEKDNSVYDLRDLRSRPDAKAFSTPPLSPTTSSTTAMDSSNTGRAPSPTKDIPEFKGFGSVKKNSTSSAPSPAPVLEPTPSRSASSLARSGTLSWQQRRPGSRGGSRPTSMVGAEVSGHSREASRDQPEPSREQIAASLGSRDPSWFKQTADRGTGSAAYRRNKDEAHPGDVFSGARRGLPGLSRETSVEPERQASPTPSETVKSETSRPGSIRDSGIASSRFSSATSSSTPSKPDLKSLIAADEAQQEASPPTASDRASSAGAEPAGLGRTPSTMSSSQARLANAPDRPSSPTKGMGGFVQSAMMKRSDSVNKRWSAQPGASLSRQGSVASQRSGYGGLQGSYSMPKLEPTPGGRETSNEPASRPSSSSSNLTALAQAKEDNDGFVKPALPHHSRSKSVASTYSTTAEENATSPPSSPSKRFSPTKSSWIESALTRPDSPKPAAPRNAQPSWMANIAKAKAERASADSTPRSGTPNPPAGEGSRPASPVKTTPFGQSVLRRSESRDLGPLSRSGTPSIAKTPTVTEQPTSIRAESPALPQNATPAETKPRPPPETKKEPTLPQEREPQHAPEPIPKPVQTPAKPGQRKTEPVKSPPIPAASKPKPDPPAKPQTDFRSTLRSRPVVENKASETPEFLSKVSNLRKTQTEKYVAPDIFGSNIKRGKSELTKTDGPVKTQRRDELKESLLAKKEDWKKAKEEGRDLPGQVHERKRSGTAPATPSKPEALAKRELLGRSERLGASPEKPKAATPEALSRHKSMKEKPMPMHQENSMPQEPAPPTKQTSVPTPDAARFEHLSKQRSAPGVIEHKAGTESSKLASRFNPGLASILARGPPSTSASATPSRSESPATLPRFETPAPSEAGAPLQDMRKGRAKGPKKRKAGGAAGDAAEEPPTAPAETTKEPESVSVIESSSPLPAPKPRAPPGSAASLMMTSLGQKGFAPSSSSSPKPGFSEQALEKPATPAKSPTLGRATKPDETARPTPKSDVPEFGGFVSMKRSTPAPQADDDKENSSNTTPSVKSAASFWGRQASPKKAEAPPQISLPSKRDEEAAMRSAGLLASSPARPGSRNGLGISVEKAGGQVSTPPASAGMPPKPAKPSRVVSGKLQEASPNKGASTAASLQSHTETERVLTNAFGTVPISSSGIAIDVRAVIAAAQDDAIESIKTLRRSVQEVVSDGSLRALRQPDEYTLFDESAYICSHTSTNENGPKQTRIFIWSGASASASAVESAESAAKRLAREAGSAPITHIRQGYETAPSLQALGGILITRRGAREGAPKQYMLCGRKHLGHITFDEVDFDMRSLCCGFVYLISYPVTLQETKLYLWKGGACSAEELSAARLAAMDLSETGEIIEVDDGAEFASFLRIFGAGTTKASITKAGGLWQRKALKPDSFETRLFRIQQAEQKVGLFAGMFTRRPSWNSLSPSRSPSRDGTDVKVEAKEVGPFTQADLDAEGMYVLDACGQVFVLIGPLVPSLQSGVRDAIFAQALLFAQEYADVFAQDRASSPPLKGCVIMSGIPRDVKMLFRHWNEDRGLWGTAGLMAGSQAHSGNEVTMLPLDEVRKAVCRG